MPDSPENKKRIYVTPTSDDVLCGRGNVPFHHLGNKKLRQKIAESLDSYKCCQSRQGRTIIIRETIRYIRVKQGGRFLKADKDGRWYDGGMKAAKIRVGTAFRDAGVPNKVKCMKALQEENFNPVSGIQFTSTTTLPAASPSNDFAARRDSLSNYTNLILENETRGSFDFGALHQVQYTEIPSEDRTNPVKSKGVATRRDSLTSLPLAFKTSKFASRRDSLSSLLSQTGSTKRESLDSSTTFGSYAPTISTSRGSLDSSISTLDSELLTGLSMPELMVENSGADSITHFAAENNDIDHFDFGGRNFFDITESVIAERNKSSRESNNGEARRVSSLPEDFYGKMITFAVAPSA